MHNQSLAKTWKIVKIPLGGRNSGNHWNLQKQYYFKKMTVDIQANCTTESRNVPT